MARHFDRMQDRLPCVYILASQKRGTLYIGVTSDLAGRIWQHRNGATKGFASRYRVFRLVHAEFFDDMYSAITREKQLKRWHRAWKIKLIEAANADWRDLAVEFRIAEPVAACAKPHLLVILNSFQDPWGEVARSTTVARYETWHHGS